MKNKKRIINTSLSVVEYAVMVNSLVAEFFDSVTQDYQPHFGNLNAMRLFYNHFYKDEVSEEIIDALDMNEIVNDDEFIQAFNSAINTYGIIRCDFGNAYHDAIEIVDVKKVSVNRAFSTLKDGIVDLVNTINPLLDSDNLEKVFEVAQAVQNGKITADSIIKSYKKSDNFKEFATSAPKDEVTKNGKVITYDHFSEKK